MKTKLLVLAVGLVFCLTLGLAQAQGGGETVAAGLNGPMGVLVAPDGSVWVVDSGLGGDTDLPFIDPQTGNKITAKFGESARIVQIMPEGTQTDVATLPSIVTGMDTLGGARLALLDGTLYATSGQMLGDPSSEAVENGAAVLKIEEGQVSPVASTWELERSQNPDGFIIDSHPYAIAAGSDGKLWVTDAAGNALLQVDPATGEIEVVTVFEGVPGPLPNPNRGNAMETDPVPTGLVVDPSGTVYVSFLPGFPFTPGSAKVVQVSPDGTVSDYATGLTMLTDLRQAPDGTMYAVQFAEFTEQGPTPNSGRVYRVQPGEDSEVVLDGLSFPTSIDFNQDGDAYVTINGVGAPGSGEVVRFANLIDQAGTPLAAAAPTESEESSAPAEAEGAPPAAQEEAAPTAQQTPASLPTTGGEPVVAPWQLMVLGVVLGALGWWLKGYALRI